MKTEIERTVCYGEEACLNAVMALMAQADRQVDILTLDFEPAIYDQAECVEMFETLALRSRHSRVRILVQNPQVIVRQGHRLLNLALRLDSVFQLRCLSKNQSVAHSCLLVDGVAYWHRAYQDSWKAFAHTAAPQATRALTTTFNQLWHEANRSPYLRQLQL
jgi:hypothetical protein